MTSQKPLGVSIVILLHVSNRTDMNAIQDIWDRFPLLFFEEDETIPWLVKEYGMACVYVPLKIVTQLTTLIRSVGALRDVKVLADVAHALV